MDMDMDMDSITFFTLHFRLKFAFSPLERPSGYFYNENSFQLS